MHSPIILALLALASLGVAAPTTSSAYSGNVISATQGTTYGSAIAPTISPQPKRDVDIDAPPKYVTITIVNSHTYAISTTHYIKPYASTPVSGGTGGGVLTAGQTASFVVPTGWAGSVGINDAADGITGDDSQINANFTVPGGSSAAVADVAVSYINGFSGSIVCSCAGSVVTGCNLNLFNLNTCSAYDNQGACINPQRSNSGATHATPFFRPCSGAAYTFINDNGANSFGQCQSGHITCCAGDTCPANPNQPS